MAHYSLGVATRLVWLAVFVGTGGACAWALGEKATAELKTVDGREVGSIKMVETTAGVLLKVKLKGLTPGVHGFHIHEAGKCEGDLQSAGGIYNPLGARHGYLNDEGPMVGDLPNLFVGANGELELEMVSPFVTLNKAAEESIFDADGTAFILFEKADDYVSEPEGNAGARVACGVILPAK
jgi:superoxide dismutase, Cu-Zn family